MPYQRGFADNSSGKNWWETSSGGHIEPIGGGATALLRAAKNPSADAVADMIDSHRDLTFGNGDKPGILGTGQFNPMFYTPDANASQIPDFAAFQRINNTGYLNAPDRAAAQMDTTQQDQTRAQQMGLANMLQAQANGTAGPSAAQLQLQRGMDSNMAQAMAMQAAQRGQGAGAAMRQIGNQRAAMGQQTASDSALMRAQEQMQAQNQYGQLLAGMRGQDVGVATANLQSQLAQRQMNDQMVQFYLHSGMSMAQAQQQAAMDLEKLRVQQNLSQTSLQNTAYENAAQSNANLTKSVVSLFAPWQSLGGVGGGGGGGGGAQATSYM